MRLFILLTIMIFCSSSLKASTQDILNRICPEITTYASSYLACITSGASPDLVQACGNMTRYSDSFEYCLKSPASPIQATACGLSTSKQSTFKQCLKIVSEKNLYGVSIIFCKQSTNNSESFLNCLNSTEQ